jgi:hypothetical protein
MKHRSYLKHSYSGARDLVSPGTQTTGTPALLLYFFFLWLDSPWGPMPRHFTTLHDHTDRHTTVGRTPLDEGPARRRDLTTQHLQQTDIHALGGIRTHDPSKRAAADPSLRPHDHWDRPPSCLQVTQIQLNINNSVKTASGTQSHIL